LHQRWFIENGTGSHWAVLRPLACCCLATHTWSNVHTTADIRDMAQSRHGSSCSLASSLSSLHPSHIQFPHKTWSPRRSTGYCSHPHIWFTVSKPEKENIFWIDFREREEQWIIKGERQIGSDERWSHCVDILLVLVYKSQQDAHVTEFILSDNSSTCFGRHCHPSSEAQK